MNIRLSYFGWGFVLLAAHAPAAAEEPPRVDRYGDPLPPGAIGRIGTVRFHHGDTGFAVRYSPDGKTIAELGGNGIRLWDAQTGKQRHFYERATGYHDGYFSPDGQGLWLQSLGSWTNSPGREIFVWKVNPTPERQPKKAAFEGTNLTLLAPSPDGKTVAIGDRNVVRLCKIDTGEDTRRLTGHTREVARGRYSADGKLLATFDGAAVLLWSTQSGTKIRTFQPTQEGQIFRCFALSPDGKRVATDRLGQGAMEVSLWDAATGKELWTGPSVEFAHRDIAFSPDGKVVVIAGQGSLRAWDVESGKKLWEHSAPAASFAFLDFSPDSKTLATSQQWGVHLWDARTGKERRPVSAIEDKLEFLTLLDGGRTAVAAFAQGQLRYWHMPKAEEYSPPGSRPPVVSRIAAVSPNGKVMASVKHGDRSVQLWDTSTGKELRHLLHELQPEACYFSPDSRLILVRCDEHSPQGGLNVGAFQLWDVASGKEHKGIKPRRGMAGASAFSPDGNLLATEGENAGTICIWSVASGEELRTIAIAPTRLIRISFSANGRLLAGTAFGEFPLRLWEVASGKEVQTLQTPAARQTHPNGAFHAAIASDDRTLFSTNGLGDVMCWDIRGGTLRKKWHHQSIVQHLALFPDCRSLLTGDGSTALVWDIADLTKEKRTDTASPADVNALWADLQSEDATRAYQAIWKLPDAAAPAIKLLRQHLRPTLKPDSATTERIAGLIGDLDSETFAVRDKASQELASLGRKAAPALRKVLADSPSTEMKRRLEDLLAKMPGPTSPLPPEQLRELRALAVLEYIATDEARDLLTTLAHGHADARLTQEAKMSLQRLNKRQQRGDNP